jgi:hypothetical protein
MLGCPLPSSGAGHRDGRAVGEQAANNGESRGRDRQQGTSAAPPGAGSYRNQTTGEPFSWAVAGRGENRTDYFRPTDRRLTERKNGFGRIVAGYGHGYG